jgi:hypothetical protein
VISLGVTTTPNFSPIAFTAESFIVATRLMLFCILAAIYVQTSEVAKTSKVWTWDGTDGFLPTLNDFSTGRKKKGW